MIPCYEDLASRCVCVIQGRRGWLMSVARLQVLLPDSAVCKAQRKKPQVLMTMAYGPTVGPQHPQ